jgi:hypothetical protein
MVIMEATFFSPYGTIAPSGQGSPYRGCTITLINTTPDRTTLDGWSFRWRDLNLTIQQGRHTCPWRVSNLQSQEASGHRPTHTARPLLSLASCCNLIIEVGGSLVKLANLYQTTWRQTQKSAPAVFENTNFILYLICEGRLWLIHGFLFVFDISEWSWTPFSCDRQRKKHWDRAMSRSLSVSGLAQCLLRCSQPVALGQPLASDTLPADARFCTLPHHYHRPGQNNRHVFVWYIMYTAVCSVRCVWHREVSTYTEEVTVGENIDSATGWGQVTWLGLRNGGNESVHVQH